MVMNVVRAMVGLESVRICLGNAQELAHLLTMDIGHPITEREAVLAQALQTIIGEGIERYDNAKKAVPQVTRLRHAKAPNRLDGGYPGPGDGSPRGAESD